MLHDLLHDMLYDMLHSMIHDIMTCILLCSNTPLLAYGMNTLNPKRLRSMWLTDVRRVVPELRHAAPHVPFSYDQFELGREWGLAADRAETTLGLALVEKNWSPFRSADGRLLYVHADWMGPRRVFQVASSTNNQHGPFTIRRTQLSNDQDFALCMSRHFLALRNWDRCAPSFEWTESASGRRHHHRNVRIPFQKACSKSLPFLRGHVESGRPSLWHAIAFAEWTTRSCWP